MKHLLMVVEGATEQQFVMLLLAPHLAARGVVVSKPRLIPTGKAGRGGVVNYEHARRAITSWLRQQRGPEITFTTMFDLYKLPRNFPGYVEATAKASPYLVVESLENALAEDIKDERFIPYIQLHEFETLLFADPQAFSLRFADRKKEIEELIHVAAGFGNPEMIDDGESTAPSKRITRLIPEYRGAKRTAGPDIAQQIGIDKIRSACRHFNDWLTRLEGLGKEGETL